MTKEQIEEIIGAAEELIKRYKKLDSRMMEFEYYAEYKDFLDNFVRDHKDCLLCIKAKMISKQNSQRKYCYACIYNINKNSFSIDTIAEECTNDLINEDNFATYRTIYFFYTDYTFRESRNLIKKAIKYRIRRIRKLIKQYREREKDENR